MSVSVSLVNTGEVARRLYNTTTSREMLIFCDEILADSDVLLMIVSIASHVPLGVPPQEVLL